MMFGRIRATPEVNFDNLKTDENKSFEKKKFIKATKTRLATSIINLLNYC